MGHEQLDESQMSQSRFEYAIADAKKAEVMVKYVPTGEYKAGQLHLNVGDVVWVLEESDGWWGGHKDGDDQTGWFPAGICQIIGRGDDDSFEDGERAFCTADGRAVASPQAKGRSQVAAAQVEVAETKAALEQEKKHVQAAMKRNEALEEQLKGLKQEQQEWLLERHRWTRKAEECESKAKHYQNECRSKEAELAQAKDGRIAAEVKLRDEKSRTRSLEAKLSELEEHSRCLESHTQVVQQALDAAQHAAQHALHEREGRSSGRGQTRAAVLESSGHRTPSAPHTVSTLHPSSGGGSLQVPVGGTVGAIATSVSTVGSLPLSARQPQAPVAGTRHASPRHGHASTSWMPPAASGSGGPPASPHMRQRILSQRDMALETNTQAPVRNIISEFERRSNSQGAPLSREPLPTNRQLLFANGSSQSNSSSIRRPMVMSACTMPASSSATIRAGSREALPLQLADPETPHASPNTRGEERQHLNFGMSPIKRTAIPMPRGGPPIVPSMPSMSYSPPSRSASGTVSVQERVRQLQQRR